ncbi:MAG: hypothetical protein AAGF12_31500 [Myxococcota bacterium]
MLQGRPLLAIVVTLLSLTVACGDDSPGADDDAGRDAASTPDSGANPNPNPNPNPTPGDPPSGTFRMDAEGWVVFDIEEVAGMNPPDPWVFRDDAPCANGDECGHLGDGYYQFTGAGMCSQLGRERDVGQMEVSFEVQEAGLYRFAWRNLRDHTGGCGDDRNNDSYVSFPTSSGDEHFREPFKVFGGGSGSFNWTASYDIEEVGKNRVCIELEAGTHTLRIAGRSNQHVIDRVAIGQTDGTIDGCRNGRVIRDLDDREPTGRVP